MISHFNSNVQLIKKAYTRKTEREMTTPLFMLRCVQLGISIRDLDLLTIGMVTDMVTESQRDSETFDVVAGQKQFDAF